MISAILLAAGASVRMGARNKLLLHVAGEPLVRRSARVLMEASVGEVVVVVGHEAGRVGAALAGLPLRQVLNAAYPTGMTSSIQAGVRAAAPEATGLLLLPADLPLLTGADVDRVVDAFEARHREDPQCIVVPVHAGQRGHPLIFSGAYRAALLAHPEPDGCRGLLRAHRNHVREVSMPADHIYCDVDTPAAYARLIDAP